MSSGNRESLYEKNTRVLRHRYPSFREDILDRYSPSDEIIASETPEGLPTARIDNIWIHSSRQPVREAQKLVESGITARNGLCLVYGFGLGYHAEALRKHRPDLNIIIIEPEPGLFLRALQLRDFSTLFSSGKTGLLLAVSPSALPSVLRNFQTMQIQTLKLRPVQSRNADYYEEVDRQVRTFIRKKETNLNTLNRFGRTWTRNLFRNIDVFAAARDCGMLYDRFAGIPALVIAAGPSLDDILPYLPELKKRCLVVCVDTAVRAVCATGTAPDIIVVVDPQYLNTRHLDNLLNRPPALGHSLLLSESSTHPSVFRNSELPVFFYRSFFPLGRIIEKNSGISAELGAGGSVATTAWDLARKLGCREIYAAGLDLGFPDHGTHCRNSLASLYSLLGSSRLKPLETFNFINARSADPYPVENNSGGITFTDRRLEIYKWWFEGQIESSGGFIYGNLSPKGIRIEGMPGTETCMLLQLEPRRDAIDAVLAEITGSSNDRDGTYSEDIAGTVRSVVTECFRLESVCGEALGILEKIDTGAHNACELIEELGRLDSAISDSPTKEITEFIIQPVLTSIIDEEKDMIENSRMLYTSIREACEYHRIHAERALSRMT